MNTYGSRLCHCRDLNEIHLGRDGQKTVVAFGSFDGLHQGHRLLLERVRQVAEKHHYLPVVLTFENHPLSVLAPPYCPQQLLAPQRKRELLEQLGMAAVVMPPFTQELAHLPAKRFITDILLERLGMAHIICGYDCRFGHKGLGNGELLRQEGQRLGFGVEIFEALRHDDLIIGSSGIRELLSLGQVETAMQLLERPHELKAKVIHGEQRGRQLGFPTANLQFDNNYQTPANGVYAVWADVRRQRYGGMINLGRRPTFGTLAYLPEVHLFDFSGDIYDETITVYFLHRIRDEKRFENAEALKTQIEADRLAARTLLLQTAC